MNGLILLRQSKKVFMFINAIVALAPCDLLAYDPSPPSRVEALDLPPYCAVRMFKKDESSPEWKYWVNQIGGDFLHVHHYCWAINFEKRAISEKTVSDKSSLLQQAIGNYDYMVNHAKQTFVIMPDVYYRRGSIYAKQKKYAMAASDLNRAIELNPKLTSAYNALADLMLSVEIKGNREKALILVTEGLKHSPDAKSLMRKYTELGGKLPYPVPYAAIEVQPKLPEPEKGASSEPALEMHSGTKATVIPTSENPQPVLPKPAANAQPERGGAKNPWCRFCPEAATSATIQSE